MMRIFIRNATFAVAVVLLLAASAYPPAKKLRLGKDLRGGVTLVYSVQVDRQESADEVIGKTIEVLKERVDPNGLYEISMVAQGNDRIEVTMPLPGPRVKELRQAFEAELSKLRGQSVAPDELERVLRLDPAERAPLLEKMSAGEDARLALLRRAAESLDRARAARAAIDAAQLANQPDEVLDQLADQAAQSEIDYEEARNQALSSALDPDELRRALSLSTRRKLLREPGAEEPIALPSQRERVLDSMKAEHPELVGQIDAVIAAYETYVSERDSLDDPNDLKRLLSGAGVLSFRITVDPQAGGEASNTHPEEARLRAELREKGPRNVRSRDARWLKIDQVESWFDSKAEYDFLMADPAAFFQSRGYVVEEYQGEYYMLCWDTRDKRMTQQDASWAVSRAFETRDQLGKPAIGFQMNPRGATLLGELTSQNVNNKMAVLLDERVYTAPNLLARISTNGIIQGDFPPDELAYIIRVLNAGSLQARLSPEPISEITVAPELGADNLRQGLHAGVVALIVIGLFMIVYYYVYGVVAVVCLLANAVCIVGAMALARASFTLPGIAGVILTFGMAVDANVLIFERVREELRKGLDLRVAMKLGFGKALSSIVDGNVTNLIVCFVLGYMGTQEIRGFAITLGIGVVSTLFSALVLSRVIFVLLIDIMKIKHMGMLPMTLPVIDRVLEPRVNWLRLRYFFIPLSIGVVGLGLAMIAFRGEKMLDAEFRGGTAVTLELARQNADDPASPRRTATRAEVEERVHAIGEGLAENDPLRPLRAADVVPVNPEDDGVTSDRFIVRTYATESELVLAALVERLDTLIDALPALSFRGQDAPSAAVAPAYPVVAPRLGDSVGRPEWRDDVSDYLGGVAIVLENIEPRPRLSDLVARLDQMRTQPDFSNTLGRRHEVRVLAGSTDAVESAVVLVRDEGVSAFDSEAVWNADVRDREWSLAQQALTEPIVRASVQNFSPAIADTFRQQAIVAVGLSVLMIVLYIWVRFGGARYSLAAIATLTHDVVAMIGLIAFAEILYDSPKLASIAQSIGIQPFKIDLNLVAAILTIIGYSLNDTIIIMDRIRENRGKLPFISARVINESINQTISRTIITSGTTLLAVVILYVDGGMGVRAFSYALLCGILVGTYSSIAVSAPLVWSRKRDLSARAEAAAHEGEAATKA